MISIIKNIIFKSSLEIMRVIIPIISLPYIYRIFKPDIMGKIEFSQSIKEYFLIFVGFGVYTYGLREVSQIRNDKKYRDKLFTDLFVISMLSTILVTLIYFIYIIISFNSDIIVKNMLLINAINLLSQLIYTEWVNEAFENYKFISIKTIIIKVINLICIFLFIKTSEHFYRYLLLVNIFVFFNNIISFIFVKRYISFSYRNLEIKKYLYYLFLIVLISNLNILYTQLDKIMLGFYGKKIEEIAYYGIGQKVMLITMGVVLSIVRVMMPRLSFYLGEKNKEMYEYLLNRMIPYVYILICPISVGIGILSKEIVLFFGGIEYVEAQNIVIIFGLRLMIITFEALLVNQVIFLNKREKVIIYIYIIGAIFNILFKVILINSNYFNMISTLIATIISELIVILLEYLYIIKYLNINIEIFKITNTKYFFIALSFIPVKYYFKNLNYSILLTTIIIFGICVFLYFIILLIMKDKYLYQLLDKILKKIKG